MVRWPDGISDKFDRHWIPEPNSGCWLWIGACNEFGYGKFRKVKAHRFSYERANGKIPDDLHIDHLCRNVFCVNPDHLEAVTQAENNRRAVRQFDLKILQCDSCGADVERRKNGHRTVDGKIECRKCIHARASKKYSDRNPCKYYYENREALLRKAKERYQKKKRS